MNCPYCGKELILGFIYGANSGIMPALRWLPETMKPTIANLSLEADILQTNIWSGTTKCYKCDSCKKLIINLNE